MQLNEGRGGVRRRAGAPARWLIAFALTFCGITGPAGAAQGQVFSPPPPEPTENGFDWIKVPSGEWLGGTITALYDDVVEFDSDHLGDLTIDWADVVEMHTAQSLRVRTADQQIALGQITVREGQVTVAGETPGAFDQTSILAITPPVDSVTSGWSASIGAGINVTSGNTEEKDSNIRFNAERRSVNDRILVNFLSNFSETEGTKTADNHRLNANWDRFVNQRLYWTPLTGEYFSDEFRNIDHRVTVGVGLGYELVDTARIDWRVSAGPAYQKTWFVEVEPGEDDTASSPAFTAGTWFDYALTGDVDLFYNYQFQITNEESGRYSHHMETGASIDLIGDLSLAASYVWDRIEKPQPDENGDTPEQDDFQLLLNLNYSF